MPLSATIVGRSSPAVDTSIDSRWLMSYAAGIGCSDPCYLDTLAPGGIVGHPMFPVCVEWVTGQGAMPPGPTGLTPAEAARGVHYRHDLQLHQPVRPGVVRTTSSVVSVGRHRAGALMTTRIDASYGPSPAWTTWTTALFRDVDVDCSEVGPPPVSPSPTAALASASIPISATAAHVYTECARIWNPIHTDPAVAHAAGLPGIILHGTATLAIGVSQALAMAGVAPSRAARVAGQFGAMVLMPNELTVHLLAREGDVIAFEVVTADGERALRNGMLTVSPAVS